jgi:zinc transporter ZupT
MGTLPTIAVIGAAVATAMKMTPNVPTALRFAAGHRLWRSRRVI